MPTIVAYRSFGFLATLATGLATGLGALPVLFTRELSARLFDALLGFAAGVMLAATAFSLLVPSIELGGPGAAAVGLLAGAAVLALLDRVIPHLHTVMGREGPSSALQRLWLFVLAITLHNFPEGLGSAWPSVEASSIQPSSWRWPSPCRTCRRGSPWPCPSCAKGTRAHAPS